MSERTITTVCAGWKRADGSRVHTDVRVLKPGDSALPVSHGACPECARVIEAWGTTERKAVTA